MIVIGDEILDAYVHDTNGPWLAERLRHHGIPLSRIHHVRDDPAAIGEALQLELARSRPRLVVTSGGVGATPDDVTYSAVAASLGRGLVDEPVIQRRIHRSLAWAEAHGMERSEDFVRHLVRTAQVPDGSRLLDRPGGWVPGVLLDVDGGCTRDGATILILPGMPAEFRALVSDMVEPTILAGRNEPPHVIELGHGYPESLFGPVLEELALAFPDVRIGSYPGDRTIIRVTGVTASRVKSAADEVAKAIAELEAAPGGAELGHAWASWQSNGKQVP